MINFAPTRWLMCAPTTMVRAGHPLGVLRGSIRRARKRSYLEHHRSLFIKFHLHGYFRMDFIYFSQVPSHWMILPGWQHRLFT